MSKKGRAAQREEFWRKAVRRQEHSGLSVVDFCQQEGVTASTFYYWRREIQRRDDQRQAKALGHSPARADTPGFAPLRLIEDTERYSIEIIPHNGWVIRIGEGAASEHVRRILQLVREIS